MFNSDDLIDGVIKLSVFSDIGSYMDDEDLQQDIDFCKDNDFIKPNEYLDENGFSEGITIRWFFKRLNINNLHVSEISPVEEIRLDVGSKYLTY